MLPAWLNSINLPSNSNVNRLLRLALPLTLVLWLAPTRSEALSATNSEQGSQEEWIFSKSQSKKSSKTKKRNKNKHHHHHTSAAQTALSVIG